MVLKTPTLPMGDIAELCSKYGVKELAVFGSILGDDFGPESDVDFLVTFENDDPGPWGWKYIEMRDDLAALLERPVDLVPRRAVERSRNWIRRKSILDSAMLIYGS
jgi:predicted nucleotidyltransferase